MRKNLLTKIMVLALVAAMVLTVFVSGCSKKDDTPATTTTTTGAGTTSPEDHFKENLEVIWIVYNTFNTPTPEGSPVQMMLEERFNITIKIPQIDVHNAEQRNLFFAEGNKFNVLMPNSGAEYRSWVDQGVLRPISEARLRELMPTRMAVMDDYVDPDIARLQITYLDEFWGLPHANFSHALQAYIEGLRGDWLENVGITKLPETLDEYYEVLKKFTFDDPDQNGVDDTYGIHGGTWMNFNYVFGAHGIWPNSWYDRDGEIVYSSITDEYKAVLKLLQKWYREGLIDPEFVTDNRDMQRAKWADGKFGILIDHPWWFAESTSNNLTAMLRDKNPDAVTTFFAPVTGPDGKSGGFKGVTGVIGNATYFGAGTSDAIVDRMMRLLEEISVDDDLYIRMYWGIEGEHFEYDDDGVITPFPEARASEKLAENGLAGMFALHPNPLRYMYMVTQKRDLPPYEISMSSNINFVGVTFVTGGVNEAQKEKGEDITTLANEFYFNSIAGDIDIDAQWDAYVQSLKSAGLTDILAAFEDLIIR